MASAESATGTILIVDDQPANLRVVSALLARHGYHTLTASTGEQALAQLHQQMPGLMLLDMMMPGMDGFALLGEIKQHLEWLRLPVVFLTAAHDRDLLLRAFDAGAVDYVTKPFMPEELLARVSAHVGLKRTSDRLERVARERQTLVNLVAHDLKNPLSSVLFASDVLINDGCKPERVPRYLEMIRDSANDALGYIRSYLETQASARNARQHDPQQARVTLAEVMQWLEGRYGLQMEARGMRLHVRSGAADAVELAIDPLVLRQVCENLITNAMKYAPGSEVELQAHNSSPGYMQLVVEDRGPGIAPGKQRELFKPFTRLSENDPANGLSSGLGLSLAKQILTNLGGQLWYEDRPGGGSRFVIELPIAKSNGSNGAD